MTTVFSEHRQIFSNTEKLEAVQRARHDFPILDQTVSGNPLVYLDNAATTQKPTHVINTISDYYKRDNANVHRGVHELSERATRQYENARDKVRAFINAEHREEIIFTRGTTESINLIANSYLRPRLRKGDEILITEMEHHSNIVPWQLVAEEVGAILKVTPITDQGEIIMDSFSDLLSERTKIVAVGHISNALGTINPVQEIIRASHEKGIPVLVDGAQATGHMGVDVQDLNCDFYAFSGHKMYAPTGIGALYARKALLEDMPPWQGGGEMIRRVAFSGTQFHDPPHRFEAGTPNIAGAIGLGAAIDYLIQLDPDAIAHWENRLLSEATTALEQFPGLRIIGTAREKSAIVSFILEGVHPHDISTILDKEGIAVRAGHHCAMPLMERMGVPATTRASFSFYNQVEEVDALVRGLHAVRKIFS